MRVKTNVWSFLPNPNRYMTRDVEVTLEEHEAAIKFLEDAGFPKAGQAKRPHETPNGELA